MPANERSENLEQVVESVLKRLEAMDLSERLGRIQTAGIVDASGELADGYQTGGSHLRFDDA